MEESELIDDYIMEKLPLEKKSEFETLIFDDLNLREKVELRRMIITGIREANESGLKERLAAFDRTLNRRKKFSWQMAAVFFAVIIVGYIMVQITFRRNENYLSKYDLPEVGLPNSMGVQTIHIELTNAMNEFKVENYQEAFSRFQVVLDQNPSNDTLLYFTAVSAYRIGDLTIATDCFGKIIEQPNSYYRQISEYRIALCYLANDKKADAYRAFNKIATANNHRYQMEAQAILRDEF